MFLNRGHLGTATAPVIEGGKDATLILPINNPKKNPLPTSARLEMIGLAAQDSKQVLYPQTGKLYNSYLSQGTGTWIKGLKEINPDLKFYIIVGSDVSDSNLRAMYIDATVRPDGWIIPARGAKDTAKPSFWVNRRPYRRLNTSPTDISVSHAGCFHRIFLRRIFDLAKH